VVVERADFADVRLPPAEVEQLVADFVDAEIRETEQDGVSAAGPKHWHYFDVVAIA
jgi:hypothetical protein